MGLLDNEVKNPLGMIVNLNSKRFEPGDLVIKNRELLSSDTETEYNFGGKIGKVSPGEILKISAAGLGAYSVYGGDYYSTPNWVQMESTFNKILLIDCPLTIGDKVKISIPRDDKYWKLDGKTGEIVMMWEDADLPFGVYVEDMPRGFEHNNNKIFLKAEELVKIE